MITRVDDNIISNCSVGEFISDHNAILVSLKCARVHASRKSISVRKIKSIDPDVFSADISASKLATNIHHDVDSAVTHFNTTLTQILDKHAPLKSQSVPIRKTQPWITDNIILLAYNPLYILLCGSTF